MQTLQDGSPAGFAPLQPLPPRIINTSQLSLKTQKRLVDQRKVLWPPTCCVACISMSSNKIHACLLHSSHLRVAHPFNTVPPSLRLMTAMRSLCVMGT